MIGYVCKYTPIEIFESLGIETRRISPEVTNFNKADTLMHPNVCSYAKAVLEEVMDGDYEGVIFTTCCDSIRRLYDTLKVQCPDKFIYILDVPRMVNEFASGMFEKYILKMMAAYEEFSGKKFDEALLKDLLLRRYEAGGLRTAPKKEGLKIGLMGARCSNSILNLLEDQGVEIMFDMTCTGLSRRFRVDPDRVLSSYAWEILNQVPCLRMVKAGGRERFVDAFDGRLDGIIYHTVKFCDVYSFEYARMRGDAPVPVLEVETDATKQCAGQIRTRVEAFIESLKIAKGENLSAKKLRIGANEKMYVMGIDSGSTSTNAVILNEKKEIIAHHVVRTGAKSGESADRILKEVLDKANLKREDIAMIVSTGYGRVSIPFADENVTEISCHGRGAHYFNPNVRTILDIGGQDSKAIHLSETGEVTDFVMNDKCAAGTGRFLEMMARTLEMDISELGPESLKWKENIEISSMCSVFAESEVISLIALNKEKCDIARGICNAIAGKSLSLLKRVGLEETYMMTGGVAKNVGVVQAVEERLGSKLYICPEPEIVGALGAALFALEA